jgi:2-C-methyl-D-erythritol 2,4-cyclodiphosphate synthase
VFLTETVRMVRKAGFEVVNVSVQLIGNRPKVSTKRSEAEKALTDLVGAPVTLGATTTDGLGFLGNDEGVAAVASVLIIGAEGRLGS